MIRFYYVRHGQTLFNVERRIQGSCDSPLTEKGKETAEQASLALKDIPFDRAYSSTSERAVDTAEIILKRHNAKLHFLKGLKEFDYGKLDGCTLRDPEIMKEVLKRRNAAHDFSDLDGDSTKTISERIRRTFAGILAECCDGQRILVVSHGSYCLHTMNTLFGIDMAGFRAAHSDRPFPVPNGGIMVFAYDKGNWRLLAEPCEPQDFHDPDID